MCSLQCVSKNVLSREPNGSECEEDGVQKISDKLKTHSGEVSNDSLADLLASRRETHALVTSASIPVRCGPCSVRGGLAIAEKLDSYSSVSGIRR